MPNNNTYIKGWIRVVLLFLPYVYIVGIFSLVGMIIVDVDYKLKHPETNVFQNLIISLFNFTGTFLVVYFFVRIVDRESFFNIGLKISNRIKDIVLGIYLGFFIMGLALLFLLFSEEIVFESIFLDFKELAYMSLLYVIVSLTEEILFRGYILRNLMYSLNKPIALITSSLLFSIAHSVNPNFDFQAFINLFLAGILLGISYTFTKNLWFPIALHFSWNFFQSLFGFKVSGLESYSLIEISIPEPNLINGGEFGFEGSILSIIIQIILIIAIYIWYRKKQNSTHATQ